MMEKYIYVLVHPANFDMFPFYKYDFNGQEYTFLELSLSFF